ncbi:hypothetical protein BaRGS_00006914, partial [Batillaria attramentaria]
MAEKPNKQNGEKDKKDKTEDKKDKTEDKKDKTEGKNIREGKKKLNEVKLQLQALKKTDMTDLLANYPRVDEDELNPMQLAAFCYDDEEIIMKMASLCPYLVWKRRSGIYAGQTVLHVAIIKRNMKAVNAILEIKAPPGLDLLKGKATGSEFTNATVMMGELPLSVAALTFNFVLVTKLLDKGAEVFGTNSRGDTVFHSLVRYAGEYPEKSKEAKKMIQRIHKKIMDDKKYAPGDWSARDVWLIENNDRLTALRLAVKCEQPELFTLIINLHQVYRYDYYNDGIYDTVQYDVTEVDPVALREWRTLANTEERKRQQRAAQNSTGNPSQQHKQKAEAHRLVSVLELICETSRENMKSFDSLDTVVVREIIKMKWKRYRYWFWIWAVLHVMFMVTLTAHAAFKALLTKYRLVGWRPGPVEPVFVRTFAILILPLPLIVLPLELMMRFHRQQEWFITLYHHNGLYRLMLLVFTFSMTIDSIWYLVEGPVNNYFLILALLVGWWFTTFFMRPLRTFSFFTVMLQEILFGDMLRFFSVIILEWIAFSVAMHITYVATDDVHLPPKFETFWLSALTMFQLMIGFDDEVDVLEPSQNEWMAITLYVSFVIITYVLMLNALIAMMASTCELVSKSRKKHWELQRLSVVLMLENMLPFKRKISKRYKKEAVKMYNIHNNTEFEEDRFFLKVVLLRDDQDTRDQDQQTDPNNQTSESTGDKQQKASQAAKRKQKARDRSADPPKPGRHSDKLEMQFSKVSLQIEALGRSRSEDGHTGTGAGSGSPSKSTGTSDKGKPLSSVKPEVNLPRDDQEDRKTKDQDQQTDPSGPNGSPGSTGDKQVRGSEWFAPRLVTQREVTRKRDE